MIRQCFWKCSGSMKALASPRCSVDAMVLPADSEVLLGAIPMEDMDLVIEPKTQTIQIRPDMPFISKKSIK